MIIYRFRTFMTDRSGQSKYDLGLGVMTKMQPKVKRPSLYKVLLFNDDYTPMEFVVYVLEIMFAKSHDEATQIMLTVHNKGVGLCGIYPYDVASTKVTKVMDTSLKHEYPLKCIMEKE